ncbi:MAG: AAA family ATPase, partial [Mycoplasmatales bacterium]
MRINELRIVGFKSFANKTTIRFDDNFVGIVGPNGSGKSNIIDAIRWVFGEQSSKNMRTKSGVDVIFGGTEKKKKLNFAEVTLVLDNKDNYLPLDYNEVSVTRRLYRSGESEYLLNNIECRKKDIDELLMDSGMGKNSFSIISQGKIEEIVVSKPENRRQVVEEVAGVLKYKKRKELALRKLARTDENLTQVDLILSEMHERLGPLERQREKAIRYKDLKLKLENYEISYLANKIDITKNDYQAYKEINLEFEKEIVLMNTKVSKLDTSIFEGEEIVNSKSREINMLTAQISKKQEQISSLQADFKILNERKVNLAENKEEARKFQLENDIFTIKEKIKLAINSHDKMEKEYKLIKENFDNCEAKINELRSKRYELNSSLSELKQNQEIQTYPFSVKKILENNVFHSAKVVRDVFSVESRYSDAISACMGGRINEIIMDDITSIKNAIDYLKDNKFGRATFIPINDVRQYNLDNSILSTCKQTSGYIGVASDLISFDPKFTKTFNNVLGTTIIMDNIDMANQLAKKINNRYRIITLSGDVVSTGGTISGGQVKKINFLMGNKKTEDITKELKQVEQL